MCVSLQYYRVRASALAEEIVRAQPRVEAALRELSQIERELPTGTPMTEAQRRHRMALEARAATLGLHYRKLLTALCAIRYEIRGLEREQGA